MIELFSRAWRPAVDFGATLILIGVAWTFYEAIVEGYRRDLNNVLTNPRRARAELVLGIGLALALAVVAFMLAAVWL